MTSVKVAIETILYISQLSYAFVNLRYFTICWRSFNVKDSFNYHSVFRTFSVVKMLKSAK